MKPRPIEEYQNALFGNQSYINNETGEKYSIVILRYFPVGDPLTKMDRYSMGHVRQQFMKRQHLSRQELEKYGLGGWGKIPLQINSQAGVQEGEYISRCHIFCEDHQIEDSFWEFFDKYTKPIAMAWCEKAGFPYRDGERVGQVDANQTKSIPKINRISRLQAAMFTTLCYIGLETGEIYLDIFLEHASSQYPVEEPLYPMIHYSMGHVRQQFMKSIHVPEEELKEYCLYELGEIPLLVTKESDAIGMGYVVKSQKYLEDQGLLDAFWEFYDAFTKPIAMKWCEENGFPYKDDGSHLLKWSEEGIK